MFLYINVIKVFLEIADSPIGAAKEHKTTILETATLNFTSYVIAKQTCDYVKWFSHLDREPLGPESRNSITQGTQRENLGEYMSNINKIRSDRYSPAPSSSLNPEPQQMGGGETFYLCSQIFRYLSPMATYIKTHKM